MTDQKAGDYLKHVNKSMESPKERLEKIDCKHEWKWEKGQWWFGCIHCDLPLPLKQAEAMLNAAQKLSAESALFGANCSRLLDEQEEYGPTPISKSAHDELVAYAQARKNVDS